MEGEPSEASVTSHMPGLTTLDIQCSYTGTILWLLFLILVNRCSRTLNRLLLMTVAALYPAYVSCKAVISADAQLYANWMMYWVVLAAFLILEPMLDLMLGSHLLLYAELKLALILWLQSGGAGLVFRNVILPELDKWQGDIDACLGQIQDGASQVATGLAHCIAQLMTAALRLVREAYDFVDLSPVDEKPYSYEEKDEWVSLGNTWDLEDW